MSEEQQSVYYVDFKNTGGIVHTTPTRILPELSLTGRIRGELEEQVWKHFQELKRSMGDLARLAKSVVKSESFIKKKLFELELPEPGLIELPDSFYTGWFYIQDGETVFSVAKNLEKDNVPSYRIPRELTGKHYFLLDREEAEMWNSRLKEGPLSSEEFLSLMNTRYLSTHPSFEPVSQLSLEDFINQTRPFLDAFWDKTKRLMNEAGYTREELVQHLTENALKIAISSTVGHRMYNRTKREIKWQMKNSGLTVYPLEQGAVVAYQIGNGMAYKNVPMPQSNFAHFQRYSILGEKPMTFEEFRHDYLTMVNNNPNLFR